jgi:hypothetical protein
MSVKKVYKSMQGKIVDIEKITARNELTPAVGNVRVNARGDELGPGGKIIRKREEIMAEYYASNPNAVPDEVTTRRSTNAMPQPIITPTIQPEIVDETASEDITKRRRNTTAE